MVDWISKDSYSVKDLVKMIPPFASAGGCAQPLNRLTRVCAAILEESYEVVEAIDEGNAEHLKEELGDVLLQVVLHTEIETEAGGFNLDDVADGICKKLIYRHPHVFGNITVSDAGEVLSNWEELKRKEKGQATHTDALASVTHSLPALWRTGKGAKKSGQGWL